MKKKTVEFTIVEDLDSVLANDVLYVIEYLQDIVDRNKEKVIFDRIVIEKVYYGDTSDHCIIGFREETDEEYKRRINLEESNSKFRKDETIRKIKSLAEENNIKVKIEE